MTASKWGVLFVTTSGTALVFLDQTVMPVTLPTIERDLAFSSTGLLWVVNSYLLALAALMVVGGKLYDLFGMRRVYEWGFLLFGLGSILAALSFSPQGLILGRVVQGMGGALLLPTTGAILMETFLPGERGKALGINTGIGSLFLVLGPAIGGFFTQYLSWRYIFWINVPIVLYGIWHGRKALPKGEIKRERLHYLGAFIFMAAMSTLVITLMEGEKWGWTSYATIGGFTLFIAGSLLFLFVNSRADHPLLDLSIFSVRLYRGANLCMFLTQFALMANVLWAIYFQQGLHFTPVGAGLLVVLASLPVIVLGPLAGYLFDKISWLIPISTGFVLLAFSMFWLATHAPFASMGELVIGLMPFGCAMPLLFSPGFALALSSVPKAKLGAASSMTMTMRHITSTVSIAVLTALFQGMGSMEAGFVAISYLGGFLAVIGLILAQFVLRRN